MMALSTISLHVTISLELVPTYMNSELYDMHINSLLLQTGTEPGAVDDAYQ